MKITTLVENTTQYPQLRPVHGLSLFIQTGEDSFLFDTGPDHTLIKNAHHLDLDLKGVDKVFISHGHNDHGGGIPALLEINKKAEVFMAREAAGQFYFRVFKLISKKISLDLTKAQISRCKFISRDTRINDKIRLFTNFTSNDPNLTIFTPKGNKNLFKITREGKKVLDDFSHEMALLLSENGVHTLFTGCSHSGIGNMVKTVLKRTGLEKIQHVIGGFHLFNPITRGSEPRERLDNLVKELNAFPETIFHTGHCTGKKAFDYIKEQMGDRISEIKTGTCITL